MDSAVLDHKAEQFDLVLEVSEALETPEDNRYELIAPNGMFIGYLAVYDGDWEYHSTVESDGDRLHFKIPSEVVEGFLEEVEVTEE